MGAPACRQLLVEHGRSTRANHARSDDLFYVEFDANAFSSVSPTIPEPRTACE
jgi:hypothetical protein